MRMRAQGAGEAMVAAGVSEGVGLSRMLRLVSERKCWTAQTQIRNEKITMIVSIHPLTPFRLRE
jgi:hypothetical protein